MIDKDVAGFLLEVLGRVQLSGADPDLPRLAELAVRARVQLSAIAAGG